MANGDQPEQDSRYDWLYERQPRRSRTRRTNEEAERDDYRPQPEGTRVLPAEEVPARDPGEPPAERPRSRDGAGGPPRRARSRRRFPILRTLLILLLAYVVFLVAVPVLAWNRVDRVDAAPDGDRPAAGSGTTYLLVGSDSREGLTDEERSDLGTGNAGGQRTDSIMLLHVPSFFGTPTLISIPRDSYVSIPGEGSNKVNAAFSFGGPELLVATLENATGLRIDEYIEIGFGGFVDVVDAVDGVELCPPEPIDDEKAHIDIPAGCQMLNGPQALGYVRMRSSDPRGDIGRVERQQEFMGAIMKRALTPGTLLNPIRYWNFGMSTSDALTAGEETGVIDMARFALAMRAISAGAGATLTVPIESTSFTTPEGASAVTWDSEEALELFRALEQGRPVPGHLLPEESDDSGN